MAKFFKPDKSAKSKTPKQIEITTEHFNHDGNSIGYVDGKICFVQGALPKEKVKARLIEDKAKIKKAQVVKVIEGHSARIKPACKHFEHCGGCQLQYVTRDEQLVLKQQAVVSLFKRFAKLEELPWQAPLTANPWHYRRAARIGVWYDRNTKQFTVGFRQSNDKKLTCIDHCPVLSEQFNSVFSEFAVILPKLVSGQYITHLEVVASDDINLVVIRHTKPLTNKDQEKLCQLAQNNHWVIALEGQKGEITPLTTTQLPDLFYRLEQTELAFRVGDFIQVNSDINRQMVEQARQWLELSPNDALLDLFCGIGNFSLPLAQYCQKVVGIEGVDAMVEQAQSNARRNSISNALFYQADLSEDFNKKTPQWLQTGYNKVLLDPARAGAQAMMKPIAKLKPEKVLYVSCDPLTIARDSAILVESGYKVVKVALMDMFSHTKHVEVMALFEK